MTSAELFGLQFARHVLPYNHKWKFYENHLRKHESSKERQKELSLFLDDKTCKHYIISAAIINICQKIKIMSGEDFSWLKKMPREKAQFSFASSFFRYEKKAEHLIEVLAGSGNGDNSVYHLFDINLDEPIHIDLFINDYLTVSKRFFLQLLSFVLIGDVEKKVLAPGQTYGNVMHNDKLENVHDIAITVINSVITTTIIKSGNISPEDYLYIDTGNTQPYERKIFWHS